ncbi:hypothetical protein PG996_000248 [Apiospora saccharicola]|uniref:Uncharacterized protein n=1 Tax=Apiospora saccharicola TaxID=335842 RepID=A0ABR1WD72_9PEZI
MAAAAHQQSKDPLDVLQQTFNDFLVNTGKALRASQKNGPRSVANTAGAINAKMADTMKTYHYALDDLESEITRAKAVLLRDLEKLQAARMPVPVPEPVAPPAPMMEDVKPQPAAVMLQVEMPSTAAHTVHPNMGGGFEIKHEETKRVAPFPDMGMGLAADVVDLTSGGDVKPPVAATTASPHVPPTAVKADGSMGPVRASPSIKQSPKSTPPMTKAMPAASAAAHSTAAKAVPAPAATQAPDNSNSMDTMMSISTAAASSSGPTATPGDGSSQNAPAAPMAPMQDFDLSSFGTATQNGGGGGGGGNDLLSLDHFGTTSSTGGLPPPDANAGAGGAGGAGNNNITIPQHTAPPAPAQAATTTGGGGGPAAGGMDVDSSANIDSLFDLDSAGGDNMDLDLNLGDAGGMGGMGENSFDELFMPDGDMNQFDDQYFQLE